MLFLTGLLFGVCTANAPAAASPSLSSDHSVGASALEAVTVALVEGDEDGVGAMCTGVWVSSTTILTAAHCVEDAIVGYVTHEDVFPRGSARAADEVQPRAALTYAVDLDHDLALLRAFAPPSGHGVAHVRIGTIEQGSYAQSMGMPLGIWYSYASGVVAAVRVADLNDEGIDTMYVQTTVPTSPGCSGGGLFDREGNLIGVTHATTTRGQSLNFYVHKSHVEALLHAQGASL